MFIKISTLFPIKYDFMTAAKHLKLIACDMIVFIVFNKYLFDFPYLCAYVF